MLGKLLTILWIAGVTGCVVALTRFDHTPCPQQPLSQQWPGEIAQCPQSKDGPTVVMICHPRCPCTAASIESLRTLLAQAPKNTLCYVIFTVPTTPDPDWMMGTNWTLATSSHGMTALADPDGVISNKLGALSSGECAIYSPQGNLLFQGGLTVARGKAAGADAMTEAREALRDNTIAPSMKPVYGCELVGAHEGGSACSPTP